MHLSPNNLVHALKYETTLSSQKWVVSYLSAYTIMRGNRVFYISKSNTEILLFFSLFFFKETADLFAQAFVTNYLFISGVFAMNGVRNTGHGWKQMVQAIKHSFPHMYSAVLDQENNKPVFCTRQKVAIETVMKRVNSMQQTIIKIHGGKLSSSNFDINKIAKALGDL